MYRLASARKLDPRGLTSGKDRNNFALVWLGTLILDLIGCAVNWSESDAPRDLSVGAFLFVPLAVVDGVQRHRRYD